MHGDAKKVLIGLEKAAEAKFPPRRLWEKSGEL
jgi:hypothetical protein